MKEYFEMHREWRSSRFVLNLEIVEIVTSNGTRKKLLNEVAALHHAIRTAMATSLISYQLNKWSGNNERSI